MLYDEASVLSISSLLDGQCELAGVCLPLPSVVAARGVESVMNTAAGARGAGRAARFRRYRAGGRSVARPLNDKRVPPPSRAGVLDLHELLLRTAQAVTACCREAACLTGLASPAGSRSTRSVRIRKPTPLSNIATPITIAKVATPSAK